MPISSNRQQLLLGLLVAVGVLTVVRDLLGLADRARLAAELDRDPEGPARGAEEILEREEQHDDE